MQHPIMPVSMKDKRKPDHQVRFYAPKAIEVPKQGDHSKFAPYRFDQDGRGMCVGVSLAEQLAYDAAQQGMIPAGLPLYFSPWWNYNWGRFMRGWLNQDDGSMPEDVATAICDHGVMPYTRWPCKRDEFGNIAMDTTDPNTKIADAIKFPNMVKSRIVDGVDGLLAALASGDVVSIAVPWFAKWQSSYRSGVLPPIADQEIDGRHCILFDGWDKDKGLFYGPNSWGEWGIQESAMGERTTRCGFAMPFEYIELFKSKFGGYDAWDIDYDTILPLPPMQFSLAMKAEPGCYGAGIYAAGSKVEVYAGKKVGGGDFSRWRPGLNLDNQWAAKTTITLMDDTVLQAYWLQLQVKRCRLFDIAKARNQREGI